MNICMYVSLVCVSALFTIASELAKTYLINFFDATVVVYLYYNMCKTGALFDQYSHIQTDIQP